MKIKKYNIPVDVYPERYHRNGPNLGIPENAHIRERSPRGVVQDVKHDPGFVQKKKYE